MKTLMRGVLLAGTLTAWLFQAAPVAAVAGIEDAAAAFGARESVEGISLSPGGTRIAYLAPTVGQGSALYTVDLASGDSRPALSATGDPERLHSCGWVSDSRLVCTIHAVLDNAGEVVPVSRVVAVDADGRNVRLLSRRDSFFAKGAALGGGAIVDWLPGEDGAVLMGRVYVPEQIAASRMESKLSGYGIDRIDTRTASGKQVETPRDLAAEYITDGRGAVRIMGLRQIAGASGYDSAKLLYRYRARGSRDWKPLSEVNVITNEGFNPHAVDADLDVAYGFKKKDGRAALYSLALDGSGRETLVFAHPQVDVDAVVRIGRRGRVVGATFATDKREAVYFDKGLERIAASLSKALPGLPLIRFLDSSLDEAKLLMWAGSDTDPGRYYLYDRTTRKLNEIMLSRPQLETAKLSPVKPLTYRSADGTSIPAYLTLPAGGATKGLPAIVMPHGGPGARDEWGFDWLAQFYASRGFVVLQPNFRGSAGYGDAWFKENGFKAWKTAVSDVNDGGRWLVSQGIADPAKLAIVGWSYGGYAALQSGVLDPDLFKAAVAVAPVTDLSMLKQESRYWSNYKIVGDYIGSGPHIREGSPAQNAGRIKAPVLIFHGTLDRNVGVLESRVMADKLKEAGRPGELVIYPKLDHYLEDAAARTDMLQKSDAFLRKALKIDG